MSPATIATQMVLFSFALAFSLQDVEALIIYRIGTPFSSVEKDSLQDIGIDFREVEWSQSQVMNAIELDSLATGSLQPNFFEHDEDIAATLFMRDGWVGLVRGTTSCLCHWDKQSGVGLVDEDSNTGWTWLADLNTVRRMGTRETGGLGVLVDLGGRFLIREVRLRPLSGNPEQFLESFDMGVSDRGFNTYRPAVFPPIVTIRENTNPDISLILDSPVTTEALHLRVFRDTPKEISIADFEVYGGGYVSHAVYESDVIEMDEKASWGEIRWSGRRDPDAQINIHTRTGTDPQPEIFWEAREEQQDIVKYLGGGGNLSLTDYKRQYGKFSDFLKPADQEDWVSSDSENWSYWSSPYVFENPGVSLVSSGSKKFIQVKAEFQSTVDHGSKLDFIEFKASVPPAVHRLLGEIHPNKTVIGKPTHFTYYIKPTIRSGDNSFNALEITTSSEIVSVDTLRIGGVEQENWSSTIKADNRGLEVILPRRLKPEDSGILVELEFHAMVLREVGTLFEGKVFDTSKLNEVRQRVIPGNAAIEIESDDISVTTELRRSLLISPTTSPNPFTPNNDGINDVLTLRFKLLRVTSAVPVSIAIFDMSGRLVRQVFDGQNTLGEYVYSWNGTDTANNRVPPGLYLYRLVAETQSEIETRSGVISLAY